MKRLSLLCFSLMLGSSAEAASLLDIYHEAQEQDATFASANAAYQAGLEKGPQGLSLLLPTIGVSANTTYNDVDTQYRNGNTPFVKKYNSSGYTLSLNQPIYRKQNFAQYEQGKSQVSQAEAQFAIAKQDLILRVAQAYFDALLAQDNVTLAGAQKAAISESLAQAKRNFEVGTATITDSQEAQARYDLTTAQEITARNDLEIKRRGLQRLIGKLPATLSTLGNALPLTMPEPNDMDKWVESAEAQNLQLQIQKAALEIATQEVERNRGGHFPTLDLVASYGDNSTAASITGAYDSKVKMVGLQLNVPIYQGGLVSSRVREAVANQEKARQDTEDKRRQIDLEANQAFLGVTGGAAQVKALEQALVSSQSSLDSTKLGFEVGVRTSVDVLNAQQQLYSAKRDLSQARYNYIMNQLKLRSAVGTLAEDDLVQMDKWLVSK